MLRTLRPFHSDSLSTLSAQVLRTCTARVTVRAPTPNSNAVSVARVNVVSACAARPLVV